MPFDYSPSHMPCKQLLCIDALSRAPLPGEQSSSAEPHSMSEFVSLILEECPVSTADIAQVPEDNPTLLDTYSLCCDQLTVANNLLLFNAHYAIPESLCLPVMGVGAQKTSRPRHIP